MQNIAKNISLILSLTVITAVPSISLAKQKNAWVETNPMSLSQEELEYQLAKMPIYSAHVSQLRDTEEALLKTLGPSDTYREAVYRRQTTELEDIKSKRKWLKAALLRSQQLQGNGTDGEAGKFASEALSTITRIQMDDRACALAMALDPKGASCVISNTESNTSLLKKLRGLENAGSSSGQLGVVAKLQLTLLESKLREYEIRAEMADAMRRAIRTAEKTAKKSRLKSGTTSILERVPEAKPVNSSLIFK